MASTSGASAVMDSLHGDGGVRRLHTAINQHISSYTRGNRQLCIVIDSVTPLLLHHPLTQLLRMLEELAMHGSVSCIITSVHKDVHEPRVLAGLERIATCVASLRPVTGLQQRALAHALDMAPHGCVDFQYKARRAGRMRAESAFYALLTDGTVSLFAPPEHLASLMTPEALVALSVGKLTKAGSEGAGKAASGSQASSAPIKAVVEETALTMAGSMRLTLSAEEQQARQSVVLPYEHQGQGTAYKTGDWKDYLPESAGGRAGQQHISQAAVPGAAAAPVGEPKQLGQIIYTRDSDDEDGLHDTDSDPDDDLDI